MTWTAEEWLDEIDAALDYRRRYGREDKWADLQESYLNSPESDTAIGPNLIYSMGDSLLSSLTVPDPEFVLQAEHPAGVRRAPAVEAIDNWLVRKLKIKSVADLSLLRCYLYGRAILKIGYDSEFGWSPYYDVGKQDNLAGMTFTQFDKKGMRIESKSTMPGMPWVTSIMPHDFVVPWGTIDLDDAPWAAHRIVRLTDYFKKDPKYKNTSRLEPDMTMEDFMSSYGKPPGKRPSYRSRSGHFATTNPRFTTAWEIHDRMSGKVLVVSKDYDKFLRNDIDAMQVCGMPFVSGTFVPHPHSFWSTPQAYYLGQIQHTQFDISLQAEKQRRLSILKFLVHKDSIDPTELQKALSGDVGAVAFTKSTRPLTDVVSAFPQGSMLDFLMQSSHNRGDAREAIGFGRNQLGEEMESSRRTAREATYVQMGSERRSGRKAGVVTSLYIDTISKVNKVCFRFWKKPRYAMVGKEWLKFTGEELEGDYLYDVSLSTKRNISKAERKVEALMMTAQLMQIPGVNIQELFQYLIEASSDPNFENILGSVGKGGQAAQGALPTIPSTKKAQ